MTGSTSPNCRAVVLSGQVESQDITEGRSLGAVYLTKPFVATALLNALERLLSARDAAVDDW